MPNNIPEHLNPLKTKIILIGADEYKNPSISPLAFVQRDLSELQRCFLDPSILGVPIQNINVFINPDKYQFEHALTDTIESLMGEDTLIFYFIGHGVVDLQGNAFLATHDSEPNHLAPTSFDLRSFGYLIERSQVRDVIMILDCSFSGTVNNFAIPQKGNKNVSVLISGTNEIQLSSSPLSNTFSARFVDIIINGLNISRKVLSLEDIALAIREKNFPGHLIQYPTLQSTHTPIPFIYNKRFEQSKEDFGSSSQNQNDNIVAPQPTAQADYILENRLHSDIHHVEDADILGYDLHAFNLFSIMKDRQTNPPINIGVLAPWGRGKTTLMKTMEHLFIKERKRLVPNKNSSLEGKITLTDIKKWLKGNYMVSEQKIPFPTVWFNPWNYQSSDMIWAGMANAVVEQVVAQLPDQIDRESFWLKLRLARIDKEELRRELQIRATLYALQFILWIVTLVFSIILYFLNKTNAIVFLGIGTIFSTLSTVASRIKPQKKDVLEIFNKYTQPPQYLNKLGTFHEVQMDLKKVFDLLISSTEPLIIFVDDLDRCSPSKIVEVVEAINVFMNGEYCRKTYFVLGMDAEMVAASLDVAYEKMKGKVINRETEQGSLGWYFLDKFVQLPFFIPVINEAKKEEYLQSLFVTHTAESNREMPQSDTQDRKNSKDPVQIAEDIMSTNSKEVSKQIFSALTQEVRNEVDKEILKHQIENKADTKDINQEVGKYAGHLNSDPRSLKRFANLLRFYNGYQILRMKKGQDYIPIFLLGKYVALMMKFPQFVRWLQWDSENNGASTTALDKAELIDKALDELIGKFEQEERIQLWSDKNYYEQKKSTVPKSLQSFVKMQDVFPWMKSSGFIKILMIEQEKGASILNALKCNIW